MACPHKGKEKKKKKNTIKKSAVRHRFESKVVVLSYIVVVV